MRIKDRISLLESKSSSRKKKFRKVLVRRGDSPSQVASAQKEQREGGYDRLVLIKVEDASAGAWERYKPCKV